jgi:pyrroline-5-carboxylate reductase
MQTNLKIAFIGGGNMAQALISGLADKLIPAKQIHVVDVHAETLRTVEKKWGVTTAAAVGAEVSAAEVIVLAVKPQQMHEVAAGIGPSIKNQLILSIAAGIRTDDLSRWLGGHQSIVRTMPNTPALIGQGITGMVALAGVSEQQRAVADTILQAVGQTVWLDAETQIDAVTAVSGSGPAYVFYFLEAMQQAAVELGLSAEQGRNLAQATFLGAAALASASDESLSTLRERVTSKGGTTYAALTSMNDDAVQAAIIKALKAAAQRGAELGKEFGQS